MDRPRKTEQPSKKNTFAIFPHTLKHSSKSSSVTWGFRPLSWELRPSLEELESLLALTGYLRVPHVFRCVSWKRPQSDAQVSNLVNLLLVRDHSSCSVAKPWRTSCRTRALLGDPHLESERNQRQNRNHKNYNYLIIRILLKTNLMTWQSWWSSW